MKKRTSTKAAFVRKHPNASPQWIANTAKAGGVTITPAYVSNVRTQDQARLRKKRSLSKPKPKSPLPIDPTEAPSSMLRPVTKVSGEDALKVGVGLVKTFKVMVIAIGTRVARQLITEVEDETSKLFGRPPL